MKLFKNTFLSATLTGLLLAASWPTYGFPLIIFIAFIPLLMAEQNIRVSGTQKKLRVWANAYWAFLIWNLITTWWLIYADLFGMLFANLVNTLLMSLLFLLYHSIAKRVNQILSLIFLIALWICFEKLHLIWDFSWPWLNLGNVFSDYPQWVQWYEFTGTFGGTLWIWIANAFGFYALVQNRNRSRKTAQFILIISIPLVLSLWMYTTYHSTGKTKEVIVLQPNVDPYKEKYAIPNLEVARGLLQQTDSLVTPNTEYILAPETVLAQNLPFGNFEYSEVRSLLRDYIYLHPKAQFLWGIDSYDLVYDPKEVTPSSNFVRDNLWVNNYNAALFINRNPAYQKYLKSKLVVGIENLPYKPILEPLIGNLMIDLGGTISTKTTQKERSVFTGDDGTKVAPVICYESVYGEYVTGYVKNNAQFLAIITNDAWWSNTQGHKQHLSLAQLRAIETRRDIARSANTGISAFINQKGDITSRTKYNEKTALRGLVHLNDVKTFYVRFGDYIAYAALPVMVVLFLFGITRRKKSPSYYWPR